MLQSAPQTARQAASRIAEIVSRAVDADDPRGYFAALYHRVTLEVAQGIEAGRFEDGQRMDRFDGVFAARYLDAFARWDSGTPVSRSWRNAFRLAEGGRGTVLQHLLVGMNAHINFDLALSAAEVAPGDAIESLRTDFETINQILRENLDRAQAALSAVSPVWGVLDRLGDSHDEAIIGFSIERARVEAWEHALDFARLAGDPNAFERRRDLLDRRVACLAQLLAEPGGLANHAMALLRLTEPADVGAGVALLSRAMDA